MFSSMIQNLLSSTGQANAMQRAVQMNNYVNTINSQWEPVSKGNVQAVTKPDVPSFEKVLKDGAKTKFGDLLTNPVTRVNAQLYTNTANSFAHKAEGTNKSKIKELISKVSQKHGVDEKLVNALFRMQNGMQK